MHGRSGCGTPEFRLPSIARANQDKMHESQLAASQHALNNVLFKQPAPIDFLHDDCVTCDCAAEGTCEVVKEPGFGGRIKTSESSTHSGPIYGEGNCSLVAEHSHFRAQLRQYGEMQSQIIDQQHQTLQRQLDLEYRVHELRKGVTDCQEQSGGQILCISEEDNASIRALEHVWPDPQHGVQKHSRRPTRFARQHASIAEAALRTASDKMGGGILERVNSESAYKLKQSMWDVIYLIGYSPLGQTSNALLCVGFAVNLIIQFLLSIIVALWLAKPEFTSETVSSFRMWRETANMSIVTKLCERDGTLATAYLQYDAYERASKYLSREGLFAGGPVLCETVVVLWTFHICCVLREVIDFVLAVHHMHRSKPATLLCITSGDSFTIVGVTPVRFVVGIFAAAMQIIITLVLLVAGNAFLVRTDSVEDLVLNAVAMNFITQVDEMIYQVVVPKNVKCLVRNLDPLPLPERPQWIPGAVPLRAMFCLAVACITMAACHTQLISPHKMVLKGIVESLCPGT